MKNEQAIEAAVTYWSGLLERVGSRERFAEKLRNELIERWSRASELPVFPRVFIGVDYDPCPVLLSALRACEVDCAGFMFSADGLFPRKHTSVLTDGAFAVSEGYGAGWRSVFGESDWAK
jgi:hypothetical protein